MRINQLKLTGFRNLKKLDLNMGEESVFAFVGPNGQGKTNLLEAIYLGALSKSFRSRVNADLVAFDEDFCRIEAGIENADGEKKLELIVTVRPPRKVLKINGVEKKASDFIGTLKAVFFSPDDMSTVSFAPRMRRRYLDVLLSQLDHDYLEDAISYQELVRQRNALLKKIKEGGAGGSELEFWDEKLAAYGWKMTEKRQSLISKLHPLILDQYRLIAKTNDELNIHYLPGAGTADSKEDFLKQIREGCDRDIASGSTQLGPHRDDLRFLLNGHDMAYFASRGEWRSLVLALKFAEISLIEEKTGEKPVLLLDDVFSELDETRQKYLMEAIRGTQTFLTTTHREFLEDMKIDAKIYRLERGMVLE